MVVVGTGGGRDVLSALAFNQRQVTGVEINEAIIDLVNRRFGDFTGHLDRDPRVRFVNDEARSYLARLQDRVDLISDLAHRYMGGDGQRRVRADRELALHDGRLADIPGSPGAEGILSVSRWDPADRPGEVYRKRASPAAQAA